MPKIEELYRKTAVTQFFLGGAIFVIMWSSLDNFYSLQREVYADGKMVFLCLGISRVISLMFGVNHQIINITKFYKFDTYSSLVLAIFTILSNIIMIKYYGLEGAAIATAVSLVIFNIIRSYFLYNKLCIQPFGRENVMVLLILLVGLGIGLIIPKLSNVFFDTAIRSSVIGVVMLILAIKFKVSKELTLFMSKISLKNYI